MTLMMMKKSVATLTLEASLKVMRPLIRMLVKQRRGLSGVCAGAQGRCSWPPRKTRTGSAAPDAADRQRPEPALRRAPARCAPPWGRGGRAQGGRGRCLARPLSLAGQIVVGVWLNLPPRCRRHRRPAPRVAASSGSEDSFDALGRRASAAMSAREPLLDETACASVAWPAKSAEGLRLVVEAGFTPHQGMEEMAEACMRNNMSDAPGRRPAPICRARPELPGAVRCSSDEITAASVQHQLHEAARLAWPQAFEASAARGPDHVLTLKTPKTAPCGDRNQRARFGVYFYSESDESRGRPAHRNLQACVQACSGGHRGGEPECLAVRVSGGTGRPAEVYREFAVQARRPAGAGVQRGLGRHAQLPARR